MQKSLNDLVFERGSEIGCTTIMIAHRLTTVEKADKIVVLDRGAIVESGTHSELKSKPNGFYAAMLAVQVSGTSSFRPHTGVCGLKLRAVSMWCTSWRMLKASFTSSLRPHTPEA